MEPLQGHRAGAAGVPAALTEVAAAASTAAAAEVEVAVQVAAATAEAVEAAVGVAEAGAAPTFRCRLVRTPAAVHFA